MKFSSVSFLMKMLRRLKAQMPSEKRLALAHAASAAEREQRVVTIVSKVFPNGQLAVLGGPFRGMRYISNASGSQLLPKLIGSYEEPLHDWVSEILNVGMYSTIIDVGCAEGYYAVGFSKAKSNPRVFGFDIDPIALERAQKLAELNDASGAVKFYEAFDNEVLREILQQSCTNKALIFMDVEGAELNLLDPGKYPAILNCDILVELHDCFYPHSTDSVIGYLSRTHEIKINVDYPWRKKHYSFGENISADEIKFAIDEIRPDSMRWIYAVRK